MAGGFGIHFDGQKDELEVARQQEAKESEGDDLQVLDHGSWRHATLSCDSVSCSCSSNPCMGVAAAPITPRR